MEINMLGKTHWRLLFFVALVAASLTGRAIALTNPVLFVTQVPIPKELNSTVSNTFLSVVSLFANHTTDTARAGRGGDLWLIYTNGALLNLTRAGHFGLSGPQHTNGIAVRDPHLHWSGGKAIFSMVVGAPTSSNDVSQFYWQLYEITNLSAVIANSNIAPAIVRVSNQPTNCNNVSPCYGTDDRIIFGSDLPPNGQWHLYPTRDEYKGQPSLTGTWSLDRNSGELRLLHHTPSGVFNPFIDSFGRLVVTRWDHLVQDSNATDDRLGRATNGSINFASEATNAATSTNVVEFFPEPRNFDSNGLAQSLTLGLSFNQFFPWVLPEIGGAEEVQNHIGRHELNQTVLKTFTNDANLISITNPAAHLNGNVRSANTNSFSNFLQITEDPLHPGTYFGVDAPDFSPFGGTHAAGQILTLTGPLGMNATNMTVTNITALNAPGVFRNPLPMSDGTLVAVFTPATTVDTNLGTAAFPKAQYQFRLRTLIKSGATWTTNAFLSGGITNVVSYWDGPTLVTHTNAMWELQPVEVRARTVPASWNPGVAPIAQQVFAAAGVDMPTFQADMAARNLAVVFSQNVTARDAADRQQPFNLRIPGGVQTLGTNSGRIYDITHLQFLQADYRRGYTYGTTNIQPGRRVLATPMHDASAFNPASSKANAPVGGSELNSDGSQATIVPAGRAVTWHLTGLTNESLIKERYWITFRPGEVRHCANCHGINAVDQIGRPPPTNSPLALMQLLAFWKTNAANAYQLAVNNGSGGGAFGAGTILSLSADPPPPGQIFLQWTGASVSNAFAPTTLFIMPGSNAVVTALYTNSAVPTFTLTVNGGTGSGAYTQAAIVSISASNAPPGQVFDQWIGATVSNAFSPNTTLVMPGMDTNVTATYKAAPPVLFNLTVNNGAGSGAYTQAAVVSISASNPPPGQIFNQWTGAAVADPLSPNTTLIMPAADTVVTATYKSPPNHPPVATPQSIAVTENLSHALTLSGHDGDNDPLTFAITVPPAHGTLTGAPPNLVFVPTTNTTGPDFFFFTAHDGKTSSAPAIVNIGINAATNPPPVVMLTAPVDRTFVVAPTNIVLSASASDADGIRRVDFFQGTNRLGGPTNAPFTFTWTNPPPGDYTLVAKVFDNPGARTFSAPVVIAVLGATPQLSFQSVSNQTIISWPLALTGFLLESASDVNGPWTLVPQPVVDTATAHTVTVPADPPQFFRLTHDF